jgi:peptidoglycan L-alanyl-D-glutamate endopeptidase CwlK
MVSNTESKAKKPKKAGFKLSTNSLKHLEGIDARLIELATEAIKTTKVDFGIPKTGGLRTSAEQRELFNKIPKVSACDGLVRRSKHQDGLAFDVYAYVDGKASWEPEHLTAVAENMIETAEKLDIPVKWGGHFKGFVDMPHFEVDETRIRFP